MERRAGRERDKQHKMELIAISDIDECNFVRIENENFSPFSALLHHFVLAAPKPLLFT